LKAYGAAPSKAAEQIITQLIVGVIVIVLGVSVVVMRYPWIIPGATDAHRPGKTIMGFGDSSFDC